MKVYIAAPFGQRDAARKLREELKLYGITSTASWIDSHLSDKGLDDQEMRREARADLDDIDRADVLILLNDVGPSTTGGMHIEVGYAIGRKKLVVVVGGPISIFYTLPKVARLVSQTYVKDFLRGYYHGQTHARR